jgi:multicomponent Na+:H+ antiporter subunit E
MTLHLAARQMLVPFGVSAGLWWVLAGGDPDSWVVGLPTVLGATWAAHRLGKGRPLRLSPWGLLVFVPFFLWESLRGGVDVALRTLAPRPRVSPGFVRYRTGLAAPAARIFFANGVSLLPGTLAADLDGDRLEVHVLNLGTDTTAELERLERAVGRLFRESGDAR